MSTALSPMPLQPLEVTRKLGLPLDEVSLRLGVTDRWLREIAKNPRHRRRVLIAELETALEHLRLAASLDTMLPPGAQL